jgi:hypothetical protein
MTSPTITMLHEAIEAGPDTGMAAFATLRADWGALTDQDKACALSALRGLRDTVADRPDDHHVLTEFVDTEQLALALHHGA